MGTTTNGYGNYNYKYNISTNTWTSLTSIPARFYGGAVVTVGTDIYLLGNNIGSYYDDTDNNTIYKYDTKTDTWTLPAYISPQGFRYCPAISYGTDIYLFGVGLHSNYTLKYDTINNSFSRLASFPYNPKYGSAVVIGDYAYIFRR